MVQNYMPKYFCTSKSTRKFLKKKKIRKFTPERTYFYCKNDYFVRRFDDQFMYSGLLTDAQIKESLKFQKREGKKKKLSTLVRCCGGGGGAGEEGEGVGDEGVGGGEGVSEDRGQGAAGASEAVEAGGAVGERGGEVGAPGGER